jgi:hypothetical protein
MSTLLNCWEGVRKGGRGRGGGLHYSLDIMSFFKDLTQKLVKSFFTNQNEDMSRHIVKSFFFANPEKRHLHYKHFVKSYFFANHEQRHVQYIHFVRSFFFANHEQRLVHHKHIFKSFFANRERRHVHYKDIVKPSFCKSRKRTCPLQRHCQTFFLQFTNKDMFSTYTLSKHSFL